MKRVAVLLSGFIKSYEHLGNLKLFFSNTTEYEFYLFGYVFDYIIPPHINKEKIVYSSQVHLNKQIETLFSSVKYVDNCTYKQYDEDGFDNRIISQWKNLQNCYELSKEHSITFDCIVRCRTDLLINKPLFYEFLNESLSENKCIFVKFSNWLNDQFFFGPAEKMDKILYLSTKYYEYLNLPIFVNMTKNHVRTTPFNMFLHFGGESEILLSHHIDQTLTKMDYLIKPIYWQILRN
jgi:hypothetical protein